jgi:hypothetical protein
VLRLAPQDTAEVRRARDDLPPRAGRVESRGRPAVERGELRNQGLLPLSILPDEGIGRGAERHAVQVGVRGAMDAPFEERQLALHLGAATPEVLGSCLEARDGGVNRRGGEAFVEHPEKRGEQGLVEHVLADHRAWNRPPRRGE